MYRKILSSFSQNRNLVILTIFLSALIIKFLFFFFVTDPIIFYKYPYFAELIAQGKDIGERLLDISPFYLFINLLTYYIYGSNWEALVIIQIIIGSLNCVFVYLIGEKIFSRKTGIIAAILIMLYGNLTIIDLTLEPEAILIFLNSLFILTLIKAGETTNLKYQNLLWFISGLIIGLAIITKPNTLLVLVGVLIWLWFIKKPGVFRFKSALLLLAGVIIFVAPITIRNYVKFSDLVLVTADSGKVFFHGNGPGANGMGRADLPHQGFIEESMSEPDPAHTMFRKTARAISNLPLKPSECSNFWFTTTLTFIKSNIPQWLFLELKKFYLFWNNYEVHDLDTNYKYYLTLGKTPLISFSIISIFGIFGMLLSLKHFRQSFLLYLIVFAYLATVLIFFSSSRYRIPAAPFLAIFAAYGINYLLTLFKEKKIKEIGVLLSIILILVLSTTIPFRREITKYDLWQKATRIHYSLGGNMLFKKGMYEKAIEELKLSIALAPNFVPAYNLLGKSYAILNNYQEAQINFQKVVDLAPELEEGYLNLGILYLIKGNNTKAYMYFEKAFSINPANEKTKKHMQTIANHKS